MALMDFKITNPMADAVKFNKAVQDTVKKAIPNAINKAADKVKTKTSQLIREKYHVKSSAIKGTISKQKATQITPTAILTTTDSPIPLINFKVKENAEGVSVHVIKSNSPVTLPHRWIETMPSGHKGVFDRKKGVFGSLTKTGGTKRTWVGARGSKRTGRLPIAEQYGPSTVDMIANTGVEAGMNQAAMDEVDVQMGRVLDSALNRLVNK